ARMHYLNATRAPVTVTPRYQWYTIDESTLTRQIAPFLWENQDIQVPPMGDQTIRGQCSFPEQMRRRDVHPVRLRLAAGRRLHRRGEERQLRGHLRIRLATAAANPRPRSS